MSVLRWLCTACLLMATVSAMDQAGLSASGVVEVWVDDSFYPSTPGWGVTHFDNIQAGHDAVADGGTVHVLPGNYYDPVIINHPVLLQGTDNTACVLNGGGLPGSVVTLVPGSEGSSISDLTIKYSGSASPYAGIFAANVGGIEIKGNIIRSNYYGINLRDASDVEIERNIFIENTYDAVKFYSAEKDLTDVSVQKNDFINSGHFAIRMNINTGFQSENVNLSNNTIEGGYIGIWGEGLSHAVVNHNVFSDNSSYDIYLLGGCHHNSLSENSFTNTKYWGKDLIRLKNSCTWNTITGNSGNRGYCIVRLWGNCSDNLISRNIIVGGDGTDGIQLIDNCERNTISENIIEDRSGSAVKIDEKSIHNTVIDNYSRNNYRGIMVDKDSTYNVVCRNVVLLSKEKGIFLGRVAYNLIAENIIADSNGYGIYMNPNQVCEENHVYHNAFLSNLAGNAFDLQGNVWDDGYPSGGNYWDDYTGEDADGDGLGDRPYLVEGEAQDDYPLMAPFKGGAFLSNSVLLPRSEGGTVVFRLHSGVIHAGRYYVVLGSRSGTEPGLPLPGGLATLPLNWDSFTDFLVGNLNSPVFVNFFSTLDMSGNGYAGLVVPPGKIPPAWIGSILHFAYFLDYPYDAVSNAVGIKIL